MPRASRGTRRPRAERVVTTSASLFVWQPFRGTNSSATGFPGVYIKTNPRRYAGGGTETRFTTRVHCKYTVHTTPMPKTSIASSVWRTRTIICGLRVVARRQDCSSLSRTIAWGYCSTLRRS